MTRSVTNTLKSAAFSEDTDEAFILLLTISHADLSQAIRVCTDMVDVVSNGNTFLPFPFEISLPEEDENASPQMSLTIDNVDRQIVLAIRSITTSPTVLLQLVLASDPDTVEASFPDFFLTNVNYDKHKVTGNLVLEEFVGEPYPAGVFNPAEFAGMF